MTFENIAKHVNILLFESYEEMQNVELVFAEKLNIIHDRLTSVYTEDTVFKYKRYGTID